MPLWSGSNWQIMKMMIVSRVVKLKYRSNCHILPFLKCHVRFQFCLYHYGTHLKIMPSYVITIGRFTRYFWFDIWEQYFRVSSSIILCNMYMKYSSHTMEKYLYVFRVEKVIDLSETVQLNSIGKNSCFFMFSTYRYDTSQFILYFLNLIHYLCWFSNYKLKKSVFTLFGKLTKSCVYCLGESVYKLITVDILYFLFI